MCVDFGRDICGNLAAAEMREWLVTNGIGGYASGTVAGLLTRRYHGLLIAALKPPLERTLLLSKIDETAAYDGYSYDLFTNRWADTDPVPHGYWHIERFHVDGTIPVWHFACADALLEKRIWMKPGAHTTYIYYRLCRGTQPLTLTLKALVNYRDYHGDTHANGWRMQIEPIDHGITVTAFPGAVPFYVRADGDRFSPMHEWYYGFALACERERGLAYYEDHLYAASFHKTLNPGSSFTLVASTEDPFAIDGEAALEERLAYEHDVTRSWHGTHLTPELPTPAWVNQLILAADQFIVSRSLPQDPDGKTIIAGYHWFSDWGRDTMISLPGLTLSTGRPVVARSILRTFARYVSQGMLPNRFPDDGSQPQDGEYNTVDATLWYFEAIRAYYAVTQDDDLLRELFPILADIIQWHQQGTRFNIHWDPADGLLYAGQEGVQLTWMDAKVNDWVVTPRIGKPVEINALWFNALKTMAQFATRIGMSSQSYDTLAAQAYQGFARFWNASRGYCYDVLDGPYGADDSLRPNQLFAVSLPESPLTLAQQQGVVEVCARSLLTSYGLRSLAPHHPQYQGHYGGNQHDRDAAYHQGTVWAWLLGPFVQAHLRVFQDPVKARSYLEPIAHHIQTAGLGTISEIFDGDVPVAPRGCIAQAWSVAEVLRAWFATTSVHG